VGERLFVSTHVFLLRAPGRGDNPRRPAAQRRRAFSA
jgi:hypothetical protein